MRAMAEQQDEGLTFAQEGSSVRAVAEALDILFPKSEKDAILEAYNEWRPRVLAHFAPRWRTHGGANIAESELHAIVREITLYWMGFRVMHREPVQMSEAEWNDPQTRRIIRAAVERRFPRGSEDAIAVCAQLTGLSREAFARWAESDETFLGLK